MTIRLGIVGAGWVARNRHLPALRQLRNVTITSVWSRDSNKAHEVAGLFGIRKVADNWEEVVQDQGCGRSHHRNTASLALSRDGGSIAGRQACALPRPDGSEP